MTTPAMQPTQAQSAQVAGMTPPKIGTPLIAVTIVLCFVTGVLGGCLSLLGMFSLMGADGCSTSTDPRQCETAVNIAAAIAVVTPAVVSIAAIVMGASSQKASRAAGLNPYGTAKAGIVLGWIGLGITVIFLFITFVGSIR